MAARNLSWRLKIEGKCVYCRRSSTYLRITLAILFLSHSFKILWMFFDITHDMKYKQILEWLKWFELLTTLYFYTPVLELPQIPRGRSSLAWLNTGASHPLNILRIMFKLFITFMICRMLLWCWSAASWNHRYLYPFCEVLWIKSS